MNLVTLARSTTSSDGLHTIVTADSSWSSAARVRFGSKPMTDTSPPPRPGHPHVRRVFLAASASVATFVFVVSAISFGGYVWARDQLVGFEIKDDASRPQTDIEYDDPCTKHPCNYLLLGSDSRKGLTPEEIAAYGSDKHNGGENRSDTIIVVHTNPDTGTATILHFPRDLWVEIPGHGHDKINTAFEGGINGGGPQLVARTIKSLTGLQINHVMYVNLAGFQNVVDALGGVPMCVDRPLYDQLAGLNIPKAGCYTFDGATALGYVRARHLPGDCIPDFARIARQQQFLRAVLNKLLSPGQIVHFVSVVPAVARNLYVDPGLQDLFELKYLADQLHGVNTGDADFRVVPTVPDDIYPNGVYTSIVRMVQPQADELFKAIREGKPLGGLGKEQPDTPPSPANIKVAVFDNGNAGAAHRVFSIMERSGFDISPGYFDDVSALGQIVKGSALLYRPADGDMADVAQGFVPNLTEREAARGSLEGFDLALVIGPGFTTEQPGGSTGAPPPSC
jgi:LCP family protein required for cell wall assembly